MDEARLKEIEGRWDELRNPIASEVRELIAEVRRLKGQRNDATADYEQIRDAVLEHLHLFAHDGEEPEPMIMAEAIKDAGEALGDLRWDEDSGELVSDERERLLARVAELETLMECVPAESLPSDYVRWFR